MSTSGEVSKNTLEDVLDRNEINIPEYILNSNSDVIDQEIRSIEREIKFLKNELLSLEHSKKDLKERLSDNQGKIKLNKQLPYLVGNVVEVNSFYNTLFL